MSRVSIWVDKENFMKCSQGKEFTGKFVQSSRQYIQVIIPAEAVKGYEVLTVFVSAKDNW